MEKEKKNNSIYSNCFDDCKNNFCPPLVIQLEINLNQIETSKVKNDGFDPWLKSVFVYWQALGSDDPLIK